MTAILPGVIRTYCIRGSEGSRSIPGSGCSSGGHPALLISNPADPADTVEYVILLEWANGQIRPIRDFRFAKYITD
jgi:hypothetical protein